MKKYIISGLFVFSVLIPSVSFAQVPPGDVDPNPNITSCVSLSNNLKYKYRDINTNGEVSTLQDFLQSQGYLNSEPTGYFGLLTLKASKDFQNANGIQPTGYVGPITRAKISFITCGTATIPPTPCPLVDVNGVAGHICPPKPIPPPTSSITVLSPNGGETWKKGITQTIKWKDNAVLTCPAGAYCAPPAPKYHDITLKPYTACDNPLAEACPMYYAIPYTIAKNVYGYSYSWSVGSLIAPTDTVSNSGANLPIPDGLYKVEVCQTGTSICDSSDSYFEITGGVTSDQPSITVLSPNGGETWTKGTTQTIKWQDTNNISTHEVKLLPNQPSCIALAGITCPQLPSYTIANTQGSSYNWNVGGIWNSTNNLVPDDLYLIQICQTGTTVCDSSNSYFKITSQGTGLPDLQITSISPIKVNQNDIITYTAVVENLTSNKVNTPFVVNLGGLTTTIQTLGANQATVAKADFGLTILGINQVCARVDIWDSVKESNESNNDYCESVSVVSSTGTQSSITVLSPNGGETYKFGDMVNIKWSSTGFSSTGQAEVVVEDTRKTGDTPEHFVLDVMTPNSGSYSWKIPSSTSYANLGAGNVYKVWVRSSEGISVGAVEDSSNATFSIVPFFTDVSTSDSAYESIMSVAKQGIMIGYGNNLFGPNDFLTRAQAAVTAVRRFNLSMDNLPTIATFEDVPTSHFYFKFIESIYRAGLTTGCSQTPKRFCPDTPITRAQYAVFLTRGLGLNPASANQTPFFSDVSTSNIYFPFIQHLYERGITAGCAQNPLRYCPEDNTLRWQAAMMLDKTPSSLGVSISPSAQNQTQIANVLESLRSLLGELSKSLR